MPSSRQSPSPTEASENRPSLGGVSFARARESLARSGPNHGFACAPLIGLRVVATMSVGLTESSAASKRAPADSSAEAQPPSVNVDAAQPSARSTARRDAVVVVVRKRSSRNDMAGP